MSGYLDRPQKYILPMDQQKTIIKYAIKLVRNELKSIPNISKIMLTGGAVNHTIGKYVKPLDDIHKRQYSDVDFVVVDSDYQPKNNWELIAERDHWQVYRIGYVDGKYPVECLFLNKDDLKNENVVELGESKGIPMKNDSKIPHETIFLQE